MANDLKGRPWIIDTASASQVANSPNRVWVTGFQFRDYANQGDVAEVKDLKRNVTIFKAIGNGPLEPINVEWTNPQHVLNLAVTTLTSGVLEIMTR